jgi:hypothetical protein
MAFEFALAAGEGAAGARYIHECWKRGHFAAHIETVLDLMWKRASPAAHQAKLRGAHRIGTGWRARGCRHSRRSRALSYCRVAAIA